MIDLPIQMHPRYDEFMEFMQACPHRKSPERMQTAFWAWINCRTAPQDEYIAELRKDLDRKHRECAERERQCLVMSDEIQRLETSAFKTFKQGDRVRKKSGSEWQGRIVGWYSTELTKEGYAVESESHKGSVQIYPVNALELI